MLTDRNDKGQFVVGNPGGPGRPPRSTEDRILDHFAKALTDEELDAVAQALVKRAKNGESKAIRVLLEYLIGTPVQRSRLSVSTELVELLKNWEHKEGEST